MPEDKDKIKQRKTNLNDSDMLTDLFADFQQMYLKNQAAAFSSLYGILIPKDEYNSLFEKSQIVLLIQSVSEYSSAHSKKKLLFRLLPGKREKFNHMWLSKIRIRLNNHNQSKH